MRTRLLWIAPLAIAGMAAFVALGGYAVMWLWNWLLPPLFGWHTVTFWQALALLALCRILFGGLGGHGGPRSRIRERVRERFGERWHADRGSAPRGPGNAPPESGAPA